ncbi:MAG: DNA topoisomerase 3 [Candidatus Nanopusillus acidilobi]
MRLYIAEKPSMGRAIAEAIGIREKTKTHIVLTNGDVITWAFGHLYELAEPEAYNNVYQKWTLDSLPIIPETFKKVLKSNIKEQINAIKSLLKQADVVINAGDPDREGQLLVDEILEQLGYKGKVLRLWVQALDKESVLKAVKNLEDNAKYKGLKLSAEYRAYADWLVGMNLTRLFTLKNSARALIRVGRVKTPTLALIYKRYKEHTEFKPKDYYVIVNENKGISFVLQNKGIDDKYLDEENRLVDKAYAEKLQVDTTKKKSYIKDIFIDRKQIPPPMPFSLSSLQKYMSSKYGWSAQKTLDTLQSLYEKKLTTYPRTDCEYLPEEQFKDAQVILERLKDVGIDIQGANTKRRHRAWDNSKLSAHHGIIPTKDTSNAGSMNDNEKLLYQEVANRYVNLFREPYVYNQITIVAVINGYEFRAFLKQVVNLGWKTNYHDKEDEEQEEEQMVKIIPFKKGESFISGESKILVKQTTPPPLFTEGTIIDAMKNIHKYVGNTGNTGNTNHNGMTGITGNTGNTLTEYKEILKEVQGIGTEATRAQIIEDLKKSKLVLTQGKALVPNIGLVEPMMMVLPDELKDPLLTAEWENLLAQVEKGNYEKAKEFFDKQVEFVRTIVERHKDREAVQVNSRVATTHFKSKEHSQTHQSSKNGIQHTMAGKEKKENMKWSNKSGINNYRNNKADAKKDWSNKNGANKYGSYQSDKPLSEKQMAIINKYAPQEIKDAVQKGQYSVGKKWLDEWFAKKNK